MSHNPAAVSTEAVVKAIIHRRGLVGYSLAKRDSLGTVVVPRLVRSRKLSGSNETRVTDAPVSVSYTHSSVSLRHSRTVLSSEADAISAESCDKATDLTALLWPLSSCTQHTAGLPDLRGFVVWRSSVKPLRY